jgi:acyl-CoA synthetase (AMP-forming)/AMP-acid ligase II
MILNNSTEMGYQLEYDKHRTIICLQVPLYHTFGMVAGALSPVAHGATSILPSRGFHAEESLKAIESEKCTSVYGTPTMFIDLYNHPNLKKYNLSSLNGG